MIGFGEFFERRWGGKRGLLRHVVWSVVSLAGGLQRYRSIDWSRVDRLVFICKGNICRSPYAEARAHHLGLETVSFGIGADKDVPANAAAVVAARARGIDLGQARARRDVDLVLGPGDLLIGMEPAHARAVEHLSHERCCQVTLLGLWSKPARPYIGDPFGRSEDFFARCFMTIDSGIDRLRGLVRSRPRCR
jgi:protein-tyrosine phosphatase